MKRRRDSTAATCCLQNVFFMLLSYFFFLTVMLEGCLLFVRELRFESNRRERANAALLKLLSLHLSTTWRFIIFKHRVTPFERRRWRGAAKTSTKQHEKYINENVTELSKWASDFFIYIFFFSSEIRRDREAFSAKATRVGLKFLSLNSRRFSCWYLAVDKHGRRMFELWPKFKYLNYSL